MTRTVATACETATLGVGACSHLKDVPCSIPTAKPGNKSTSDLANLDLLRSIAVGLVFIDHAMAMMRIRGLGDIGHFGVLLFFVHTSLVLMLSMERLGLSGSRLYTVFVVRRIFRIYPLSVLAVLLAVALRAPSAPWLGGFARPGWPGLLSNILLTQNITHSGSVICVLWSLPFEMQMYAVLPILYMLTRRLPSFRTAWLIWLTCVAASGLEYVVRGRVNPDILLLRYFPCFFAGVFAWRLMAVKKRRLPGGLWALVLAALVTLYRLEDVLRVYGPNWLCALHGTLRNDHGIWLPPYLDLVRDWVFCGVTGLAIPAFADITSRWLNAITKKIAMYSYGAYVCHVPILWLCFTILHLGNVVVSAIFSVFLTALVSFALYQFIEHPGIQFGKHLAARLVNGISLNSRMAS